MRGARPADGPCDGGAPDHQIVSARAVPNLSPPAGAPLSLLYFPSLPAARRWNCEVCGSEEMEMKIEEDCR